MSPLSRITGPADLQGLAPATLRALAREIRAFLIEKVSAAGGHLGPNLGIVELTIAAHGLDGAGIATAVLKRLASTHRGKAAREESW